MTHVIGYQRHASFFSTFFVNINPLPTCPHFESQILKNLTLNHLNGSLNLTYFVSWYNCFLRNFPKGCHYCLMGWLDLQMCCTNVSYKHFVAYKCRMLCLILQSSIQNPRKIINSRWQMTQGKGFFENGAYEEWAHSLARFPIVWLVISIVNTLAWWATKCFSLEVFGT
jgi:hypothetical protein